jgi:hypothetical protein
LASRKEDSLKVTFTQTPAASYNGGDVTEYSLYKYDASNKKKYIFLAGSNTAFFELTNFIVKCTEYNFTVTAMNGYGQSDMSAYYMVTTAAMPSKLNNEFTRAVSLTTGGFSATADWGGVEYSNGGCDLIGFGYWEYTSWNATN